jgi:hypothetical protein
MTNEPKASALIALLFVSALQAIITIALSIVELIINLYGDKKLWHSATSLQGCKCSNYNAITAACTS